MNLVALTAALIFLSFACGERDSEVSVFTPEMARLSIEELLFSLCAEAGGELHMQDMDMDGKAPVLVAGSDKDNYFCVMSDEDKLIGGIQITDVTQIGADPDDGDASR
ncbi:MAG: hypothetical protein WCT28_04445 [Patescibacteria group bacterium]